MLAEEEAVPDRVALLDCEAALRVEVALSEAVLVGEGDAGREAEKGLRLAVRLLVELLEPGALGLAAAEALRAPDRVALEQPELLCTALRLPLLLPATEREPEREARAALKLGRALLLPPLEAAALAEAERLPCLAEAEAQGEAEEEEEEELPAPPPPAPAPAAPPAEAD